MPLSFSSVAILLSIVLLLFISSVISASEIAFFALSSNEKNEIEKKNEPVDNIISELFSDLNSLHTSLLITNNFVNIAIIILFSFVFNQIFDFSMNPSLGFTLQILVLAFLLLMFCEITPKIYAQNDSLKFVRRTAPYIKFLKNICSPLSKLIMLLGDLINRLFYKKKKNVSINKLSMALQLTSDEISEEKDMLEGIIKFRNKTAIEIMTPRVDIVEIDIKTNFTELINFVIQSGFSRIPVYEESQEDIRGLVYIKDLLPYIQMQDDFSWQDLMRPAFFVPETKKIDDLLEEFRTNKIHLALVVDEFGVTSGMLTLEDILEEIVGEINDEFDKEEIKYIESEDGSYIFDAKILVTEFFKILELNAEDFSKFTENADTLAGLVLEMKGAFPMENEIVSFENHNFLILEIDKRRIIKVKYYTQNNDNS
ncbi:hemolysin [Bacteroidales bacterium]|nr:hemolysin [Bacteroidales bacterium]